MADTTIQAAPGQNKMEDDGEGHGEGHGAGHGAGRAASRTARKPKLPLTVIHKAIELVLKASEKNLHDGFRPFAAAVLRTSTQDNMYKNATIHPVIVSPDRVEQTADATAHSVMTAVSKACRKFKTPSLSGFVVVSTVYPCPMCFAAMEWARVDGWYYMLGPELLAPLRDWPAFYKDVGDMRGRAVCQHLGHCLEPMGKLYEAWLGSL